jgi:RNA polymerase sigma factor (sigma-70 family)
MNTPLVQEIYNGLCSGVSEMRYRAVRDAYILYKPLVFKRLRYKYTSLSEHEIADIVQDAFLKVYLTKTFPSSVESVRSWIMKVTVNVALDSLSEAYRKNEEQWPDDEDENSCAQDNYQKPVMVTNTHGVVISVDEKLDRNAESCVAEGMTNFSKIYPDREIVLSLAMDGNSTQEIADLYQRTEHAMRQFIYESKKKLMPFIQHCLSELSEA